MFVFLTLKSVTLKGKVYIGECLQPGIMGKIKITLDGYQCERCKHQWIPRGKQNPIICPRCKSPYWDKPKKKD